MNRHRLFQQIHFGADITDGLFLDTVISFYSSLRRIMLSILNRSFIADHMKMLATVCAWYILIMFANGDEIVENSDFSHIDLLKLPIGWSYRADLSEWININNDLRFSYIELTPPKSKEIFVYQLLPRFIPSQSYFLHWDVRGSGKEAYRIYVEWYGKEEKEQNKNSYKVFNATWRSPNSEWTSLKEKFTAPAGEYMRTYIVIHVRGASRVAFTNVKIVEIK